MEGMSASSTASMAMHSGHTGMNPILMGVMCGVMHAVGPDHLATLITFSTLMEPLQAARVGAAWGLGHSIGIIAVAFLVLCIGRLPFVNLSSWEYYGDYVIGASVIAAAIYFILREDQYLETKEDGRIIVHGCACHGSLMHDRAGTSSDEEQAAQEQKGCLQVKCKKKFCSDYHSPAGSEEEGLEGSTETTPILGTSRDKQKTGRDVQSGLVGLLQGLCCPMGLVGMGYLAGRSPVDIFTFIVVSVVISVLGTAGIAAFWAFLTRSKIAAEVNPRFIYRCSCVLALCFGVTWVLANYLGVLDKVNYAE